MARSKLFFLFFHTHTPIDYSSYYSIRLPGKSFLQPCHIDKHHQYCLLIYTSQQLLIAQTNLSAFILYSLYACFLCFFSYFNNFFLQYLKDFKLIHTVQKKNKHFYDHNSILMCRYNLQYRLKMLVRVSVWFCRNISTNGQNSLAVGKQTHKPNDLMKCDG